MDTNSNATRGVGPVLLAFLVVLGGVVGTVGLASAAATTLTISPNDPIQPGTSVTLSASSKNGNDITFAVDEDGDGNITSGEHVQTVNSSNSTQVSYTPASEGNYTVYVVEESNGDDTDDTAYPVNSPDSYYDTSTTLIVDGTAPTLDSATRVDDTTINVSLSDSIGLNASTIEASDFTVDAGAIASVDNSSITSGDTSGNVTITLQNAVDAASVNVSISQSIADTAGNTQSSGTAEATGMDGVAPSVTSVTVTQDGGNDIVTTFDTVNVTADVADGGSGVASVEVNASALGGSNSLTLHDNDSDGTYNATFEVNSSTANDGLVSLTVTATDGNGNVNDTESGDVTLDTAGPSASNYAPANGATTTEKQPTVGVDLTDANGVDDLTISVTVKNADGSRTYLDGNTTSEAGVSWDAATNRLTVDLSEAGVTLDRTQISVSVGVDDAEGVSALHSWLFTVEAANADDDSDRDGDNPYSSYSTEELSDETSESDDSVTEAADDEGESDQSVETETAAPSAADETPTSETTATETAAAADSSTAADADSETTSTGVPGFGVVVALVALLAAALLARREA